MSAPPSRRQALSDLASINFLHRRVIHRRCTKPHQHQRVKHAPAASCVAQPYYLRPRVICGSETTCHDCKVETCGSANTEFYHVKDEIWTAAGLKDNEFLCIGCLELRLKRRLVRTDFSDAPVNLYPRPNTSQRLLDRLGVKQEDGYEYWKNWNRTPIVETYEHNKL